MRGGKPDGNRCGGRKDESFEFHRLPPKVIAGTKPTP